MIPYSRQQITNEDVKAVVSVLKSDFLTTGSKINEFEEKFAKYVGSKYAVAVCNGTAALHLACLAVDLSQNQELLTSPLTFAASANCALYCGARPVFIDINEQGLIDESKIEKAITKQSRIIIPVHYAGFPCSLEKIKNIADKHKLIVIEDACHALGAKYKNSQIGDCKYSDMAVFSFHPVKHITTGEGGMITTNNKKYYEKLLMLRNHGITRDPKKFINHQSLTINHQQPWYYEIQELGFNYRLTDIQCALGLSQLEKLKRFIQRRRVIAYIYNQAFSANPNIEIIKENRNQFCSYHLYPIRVKNSKIRLRLFNYLKKHQILCQVHYIPVYRHPYYQQKFRINPVDYPHTENFYARILSLPLYVGLTIKEITRIVKEITYITG